MLIYYFYISLFFPASNSSITIVDDSETTDASSREDINTGDASLTTALAEKTRITAKQADIKPTTIVNITTAVEDVANKSAMNSSGKSETTSTVKGSYPNLILTKGTYFYKFNWFLVFWYTRNNIYRDLFLNVNTEEWLSLSFLLRRLFVKFFPDTVFAVLS